MQKGVVEESEICAVGQGQRPARETFEAVREVFFDCKGGCKAGDEAMGPVGGFGQLCPCNRFSRTRHRFKSRELGSQLRQSRFRTDILSEKTVLDAVRLRSKSRNGVSIRRRSSWHAQREPQECG